MDLYAVFIDLTKAFDAVSKETLLAKFGCARRFVEMIHLLHDLNTNLLVLSDGESFDLIQISNCVKQGYVLAHSPSTVPSQAF